MYSTAHIAQLRIAKALLQLEDTDRNNANLLWYLERLALTMREAVQKQGEQSGGADFVDWLDWFEIACYFQDRSYALEKDGQLTNNMQILHEQLTTRIGNVLRSQSADSE